MLQGSLFSTEKDWRIKYNEGRTIKVAIVHEINVENFYLREGKRVNFEMLNNKHARILNEISF